MEEVKCQALADNAQKDLEEALPALEEAMRVSEREAPGKGMGPACFVLQTLTGKREGAGRPQLGPVLLPESPWALLSE